MTCLPDPIRSAIKNALHNAQSDGVIFDVYAAAMKIRETCPDAPIRIDDLVNRMLERIGGIQAVEFSPPGLMIELIFSVDEDDEVLSSRLTKEGAELAEIFESH